MSEEYQPSLKTQGAVCKTLS